MKIAIVGSRNLIVKDLSLYLPKNCSLIITGGAKGVDTCAIQYAQTKGLPITVYLPDYARYGRGAPLVRNRQIVAAADHILAFWDGTSPGTRWVIEYAHRQGKPCQVIRIPS